MSLVLSRPTIKKLGKALSSTVSAVKEQIDGVSMVIWSTEDLSFIVNQEDRSFFGLKFTLMSTDFFVDEKMFLAALSGSPITGYSEDSYILEDEALIVKVEEYLLWRISVLESLGL